MNALYTKRNDFFQKRYQNRWIGYRRQKALGCHTKGNYTKPEELKTKRPASVSTNASLFMNSTVNLNTSVTGILSQLRSFVHLRSRNRHPILAISPPSVVHRGGSIIMPFGARSEEHTSELQSRGHLVCRLLSHASFRLFPYTPLFRSRHL